MRHIVQRMHAITSLFVNQYCLYAQYLHVYSLIFTLLGTGAFLAIEAEPPEIL